MLHSAKRVVARYLPHLSVLLRGMGPWLLGQIRRVGRHVFGDTEHIIPGADWWRNDTLWQMCLDLN